MTMVAAVDHINLVVSDLDRSARFYTELLGFKEISRAHLAGEWIELVTGLKGVEADVLYVVAPSGEPRLELLCYRSPRGAAVPENSMANTLGLRHVAFRVEDIDIAVKGLKQAGVKFIGELMSVPMNAVKHDAGQKRLCYFLDPDGVLLELAEYRS